MKQNSALIIFVRNPVLGKVKTRIAATLGTEKALKIYKILLQHTNDITAAIHADKFVFYADYINHEDLWENHLYNKELQTSIDLGERMKNAFGFLFEKGYKNVGIIGSDCYDLTENILIDAFSKLIKTEVVIGPANDGGYYFIGMNTFIPQLFDGKNWSAESVCSDTKKQLKELEIPFYLLPTLSDVDEEKDVHFKY